MTEPANRIAETPTPPYYAVVFTSVRTEIDEGYAEMAAAMDELAAKQPGYLGVESAREGVGITVSYWRDLESITAWKRAINHVAAQRLGRERCMPHIGCGSPWWSAITASRHGPARRPRRSFRQRPVLLYTPITQSSLAPQREIS